jgi:hypothetical protein
VQAISSALPLRRSKTVLFMALDCIFLTSTFELIDAVRSVSIHPGNSNVPGAQRSFAEATSQLHPLPGTR